jgi:hypothetical protein
MARPHYAMSEGCAGPRVEPQTLGRAIEGFGANPAFCDFRRWYDDFLNLFRCRLREKTNFAPGHFIGSTPHGTRRNVTLFLYLGEFYNLRRLHSVCEEDS